MKTLIIILVLIIALVGIIGAIVPALPGPPISWAGVLITYFYFDGQLSLSALLWTLGVTIVVTILDYVAPAIMTRWGGGSKAATTGATVGTFVGLFFAPLGLILGPLVGAFVGEWWSQNRRQLASDAPLGTREGHSLKVALYSLLGFLLTTGAKLIATVWMAWLIVKALLA